MIVDPTLHRQAIATCLWKALLEHPAATAKRLHVIMARASWDNAPAINACLKAGFRQTGGLQNLYFENTSNTLRGVHYFEKIITVCATIETQCITDRCLAPSDYSV